MSPSRWRALRALRVVLACLALWLPARAANAAVGPVDAVVMIAGTARSVEVSRVAAGRERTASQARAAAPPYFAEGAAADKQVNVQPLEIERRAPPPARYLLHCALLR